MSELDEFISSGETIGIKGANKEIQRAVLNTQMMRIKIVGRPKPFKSFFESLIQQQAGPGVSVADVGRWRRIVVEGYIRNKDGSYEHRDPFTKLMASWFGSEDPVKKQHSKDWSPTNYFAMNVIPISTRNEVDPWCLEHKHSMILTTHPKAYGIKSRLFKAIGECMNTYKMFNPAAKLEDLEFIVTRSGSGIDTQYGCQMCMIPPVQLKMEEFQVYDYDSFTSLSSLEKIESIINEDLGSGKFRKQEQSVTVPPSAAANPGSNVPIDLAAVFEAEAKRKASEALNPFAMTGPPIVFQPNAAPVSAAPVAAVPATVVEAAPQKQVTQQSVPPQGNPLLNIGAQQKVAEQPKVEAETYIEKCPSCSVNLQLRLDMKGRTITCPACKSSFTTIPF